MLYSDHSIDKQSKSWNKLINVALHNTFYYRSKRSCNQIEVICIGTLIDLISYLNSLYREILLFIFRNKPVTYKKINKRVSIQL